MTILLLPLLLFLLLIITVLSTQDITAIGGVAPLDYTIKMDEVITFTANTETVETSDLIILPDTVAEANEYFQVSLSLPSGAPAGDALSEVYKALVLIHDDDTPGNMLLFVFDITTCFAVLNFVYNICHNKYYDKDITYDN